MTRVVCAAALLAALWPSPSVADPAGPVVAAPPSAEQVGYAPAVVAVPVNGSLTLVNADVMQHNLVQDVFADGFGGATDRPWCDLFPDQSCPVFWSLQIGLGKATVVEGLDQLEEGRTYSFFCSIHPAMEGKLVAAAEVPE